MLPALGDDEYLVISAKHEPVFVEFVGHGPYGVRVETAGNSLLDADHQLGASQLAALEALGWHRPNDVDPDASPNFWADFPTPVRFDALAALAVATFADVHGVRHPTGLRYRAFRHDGREVLFPTLKLASEPEPTLSPPSDDAGDETVESLRRQVLEVVQELADGEVDYDEDGDLPIRFGSAVAFTRVVEVPLIVRVMSPMLVDVDPRPSLRDRLNELNCDVDLARFVLMDTTVWVTVDLFCSPFRSEHLVQAIELIGGLADHFDELLQEDFGGTTFFGEHKPSPPAGGGGYL